MYKNKFKTKTTNPTLDLSILEKLTTKDKSKEESGENLTDRVLNQPLNLANDPYTARLSEQAKNLLSGLLEKEPTKRLTVDQVLGHEWFN